ncbi:class I SAM-dependent methyltransferase [Altericista sp. CCNU0014]|uniref:class I SAM-dependent methyltransferase n=1 Tax=Altericista sp. CCNU0014 TaxID=3082949 RepID=UPI00384EB6C5
MNLNRSKKPTKIRAVKGDNRSPEQITEHYLLEKDLAAHLLQAQQHERRHLYRSLYDKLFREITHHPQITRKMDAEASRVEVQRKMNLVKRYLHPDTVFLEVGPGDCQFSFKVAEDVKKVYAVDVSPEITKNAKMPDNFELIISSGCDVPAEENSISIAYSNQLMEHLHPEDAYEQLQDLYRCLQPGGSYICITPNRLAGPHDISKYFDPVATGFHLKEYTNQELYDLFLTVGFSKITTYAGGKGVYLKVPRFLALIGEYILDKVPSKLRYWIGNFLPVRALLGVILVAQK